MRYSTEERIEITIMYGEAGRCQTRTAELFHNKYPTRPKPSQAYISKLIAKFRQTGSVKDKRKTGRRKTATGAEATARTISTVGVCGRTSVRRLARQLNYSPASVHRILRETKFKPFKANVHQTLERGDGDARSEFCSKMIDLINADPTLLARICFSDECTIYLDGTFIRQNNRFWAQANPHWLIEAHSQFTRKINVWCGIMGTKIIGPFFLEDNLTGESYLELLQNEIGPAIAEVAGDEEIIYHQDGAPPHYAREVRAYLDNALPGSWLGRAGPIKWPPRSPDLTPLDFFLWGTLKDKIFQLPPENILELRERIRTTIGEIRPSTLRKVMREFTDRLGYCVLAGGKQFEHML
jgi:hypothetical protein